MYVRPNKTSLIFNELGTILDYIVRLHKPANFNILVNLKKHKHNKKCSLLQFNWFYMHFYTYFNLKICIILHILILFCTLVLLTNKSGQTRSSTLQINQ